MSPRTGTSVSAGMEVRVRGAGGFPRPEWVMVREMAGAAVGEAKAGSGRERLLCHTA